MSCWTFAFLAQSACLVSSIASLRFFSFLKKRRLYARRRLEMSSAEKPLRLRPIWLMALIIAGFPSAMVNGGISWTTLVKPPIMECAPTRQN